MVKKHLEALRGELKKSAVDGFILPVNDEFMGEYVPASAQRLTWLTGFSGSAGMAVICGDKAAFFTDGRYVLQAKQQVDEKLYTHFNSGDKTPEDWVAEVAEKGIVMGYDPALFTAQQITKYEKKTHTQSAVWKALYPNPIDAIWQGRPAAPQSKLWVYSEKYSGMKAGEKRAAIAKTLHEKKQNAVMLTAPDSICWLLDIRGADVPYTPFVLCYALLDASGKVVLFVDESRVSAEVKKHLGADVKIVPMPKLEAALAEYKNKTVLFDAAGSPVMVRQMLEKAGAKIVDGEDPCQLPKACKNAAEIAAIRETHRIDGLAVTRALSHIAGHHASMNEMAVSDLLIEQRKKSDLFLEPSFHTIAGSGPNGAIVHYRATPESNRKIDNNSLLLIDSGGQYLGGTTDITRTIAIGVPTSEMKNNFTRVLKGHIALACAVFPVGTTGSQLDALARQYLWQAGLDYDHGTGHGVGACLSVHEGPQRISKRASNVPLKPGMVVSNEPGYYKANGYGIRIESLIVVIEKKIGDSVFLGFETLTLVPIDVNAINAELLDAKEKAWLNDYHQKIYNSHSQSLSGNEAEWLKKATNHL